MIENSKNPELAEFVFALGINNVGKKTAKDLAERYGTFENIKNESYPIVAPVYAVTYKNNPNPNVEALINWMLSEEGQYIIEETGYVGVGRD